MWAELEKIYYFMKRDIISFSTYKTNILILVMTALFGALSFAYLGSSATSQSVLQMYNMNLTTYLIIGLAFSTYLNQALTLVQKTINPWALEEVLVSPTGLSTFIVGSSLWGFIWSTAVVVVYLAIGVFVFGVSVKHQHFGNTDRFGTRHRNIHRIQHDWRRNPDPNQTRRPSHRPHNHSHKPLRQRPLPTPSHASRAASHRLRGPPILLLHLNPAYADRLDNTDDTARPADFGVGVRHNRATGLRNLCLVPKNREKKRNPLMVLTVEIWVNAE